MKSKVRTIRIVRRGHMDWFSGQAPRAKESLDKGGKEDRKMGACFFSCSCLFVRFPLLFVFLYSLCVHVALWAFRVC